MHRSDSTHTAVTPRVITGLLLLAQVHFLWMFFGADSIPQAAAKGFVTGPPHATLAIDAVRFAAQWKHGMTGNSPIYMPGFFAVGLLTWFWSLGRPLRRLGAEWVCLIVVATTLAIALAPFGAARATRSFATAFGMTAAGTVAAVSIAGVGVSLYTIFTWSVGIVCLQRAIAKRSFAPLVVPLVLNYVLVLVRPGALNEYSGRWMANLARGEPVAILSLLAIPALLFLVVLHQLHTEGVRGAGQAGVEERVPCAPFRTP